MCCNCTPVCNASNVRVCSVYRISAISVSHKSVHSVFYFALPPSGVMSVSVCLFAHLRVSETKRPNFTKFSLHVIKGRGLVLL